MSAQNFSFTNPGSPVISGTLWGPETSLERGVGAFRTRNNHYCFFHFPSVDFIFTVLLQLISSSGSPPPGPQPIVPIGSLVVLHLAFPSMIMSVQSSPYTSNGCTQPRFHRLTAALFWYPEPWSFYLVLYLEVFAFLVSFVGPRHQ